MADVTRQYLNQMKRNVQESEAFVCITFHGRNKGYKVSSNLNEAGQLQLIIDAGETIRRQALKYTPSKEEAQDEQSIGAPTDDGGRDEEGGDRGPER